MVERNLKTSLVTACVVIVVMAPLLLPGYIMSFDMAWGTHFPIENQDSNLNFLFSMLNFLTSIGGGWVAQKIILASIIAGAFLGAYKMLSSLIGTRIESFVVYLASFLYIFNPFFYTRFVTGQWLVLVGYALLPWVVRGIYLFLKKPSIKTAWPLVILLSVVAFTSIHTLVIILLIAAGLAISSGRKNYRDKLKYGLYVMAAFFFISSSWLVPLLSNKSAIGQDVLSFSDSERYAFSTKNTILGSAPLSSLLLSGFWADDQNRYIQPSNQISWWLGSIVVLGIIITGLCADLRKRNKLAIVFSCIGLIAWLLALGVSWPPSALLVDSITTLVPYYNGFREPQKWLMALSIVYVYFFATGLIVIMKIVNYSGTLKKCLLFIALAGVFMFGGVLAMGASGQLKSAEYPHGWSEVKTYLNENSGTAKQAKENVLVLPWHLYIPISFTGRVVANPTGYFFDQNMIVSNNLELKGVPVRNSTKLQTYVSLRLLNDLKHNTDISKILKLHNVDYVMLLKEADYNLYKEMDFQSGLEMVIDNENIKLYKVGRE